MHLLGTYTALITPFTASKATSCPPLDLSSLEQLVQKQVDAKIEGLVLLGTTGEAATVDFDEIERIFSCVRGVAGSKLRLILGYSSANTYAVTKVADTIKRLKPDAILTAAPYFTKPTQKGMSEHFSFLAQSLDLPMVLYNVPARSGVSIEAKTILELADNPRFVGIKDASGDLIHLKTIIDQAPSSFSVLSGNDDQNIDIVNLGGKGTISVISNILPKETKQSIDAALAGDRELTKTIEKKYAELTGLLFLENNPHGVKTLCAHLGWCEEVFRLPMTTMSPENKACIIAAWDACQ